MKNIESYFNKSKDSGKLSNFGPCYDLCVERFEKKFLRHCVPTATGTAAIQLIIQSRLPRGSKVLIPDFTHIGTLNAVVCAGMNPVIGPVNKYTWTLDPEVLTFHKEKFDAFVVVSPFGYEVDFTLYDNLASKLGKSVFYDLAGGWGTKITTQNPVAFSFHATKNFSAGEGGLTCVSGKEQSDRIRRLMNFDTQPDRQIGSPNGNNLKPDDLKCAVMLAMLDMDHAIIGRVERKRKLMSSYLEALSDYVIPHNRHEKDCAPSMCIITGVDSEKLETYGKTQGVEFKRYYLLLSEMPGLLSVPVIKKSSLFFRTFCALPSDVTEMEFNKIVTVVRRLLSRGTEVVH